MVRHLPAPSLLVTKFGMLARVAVLASPSSVLARGVERHDCRPRALFVFSLISVMPIFV